MITHLQEIRSLSQPKVTIKGCDFIISFTGVAVGPLEDTATRFLCSTFRITMCTFLDSETVRVTRNSRNKRFLNHVLHCPSNSSHRFDCQSLVVPSQLHYSCHFDSEGWICAFVLDELWFRGMTCKSLHWNNRNVLLNLGVADRKGDPASPLFCSRDDEIHINDW